MAISASQVKELRDKTGAGFMDCKKALTDAAGDVDNAVKILREKGIAKAAKRTGRMAKEGVIFSYIHPGNKIGVMVEINCETDFVARNPDFQQFAKDIAMHIAAANPLVINKEDVCEDVCAKEIEIFKAQAKNEGKPEKIWDKIAQGKLQKFFKESCLMEQIFVKDPDRKQTINALLIGQTTTIGEKISISRFARYELGETAQEPKPDEEA